MRIAVLFLLSFPLFTAGAQPSTGKGPAKQDSLKMQLKAPGMADEAKAGILLDLSKLYATVAIDSVPFFFDQAEAIYRKISNDTSLFNAYLGISKVLQNRGYSNLSINYLYKAEDLFSRGNVPSKREIVIYEELGLDHYWLSHSDSSLYYNNKYLPLAVDSLDIVVALKRIALNYNQLGITIKSLEYQLKALKVLQTYDNKQQEASIYLNVGNLYNEDGDKARAEEYYLKAAGLYKDNPRGEYYTYGNLGVLYENLGRYEESMKWLKKAEAMLPRLNNEGTSTHYTFNLANTVTHMGKPAEGIALFEKAMKGYTSQENDYGVATCYRQIAEALSMMGQYKRSEAYSLKAVGIAKEKKYPNVVQEAYWDLHRTYAAMQQFKKAYEYQKLYLLIYDSLSGQQRRSKLGLLEKEFELSNIASEKQRLEKENEISKVQAEADKTTRMALGSGLGLFVLAAGIAIMAYYRTRSQKTKLEEANRLITSQAAQLEEAARNKARFFANVSHELRTPITLLNGMLELMHEDTTEARAQDKMSIALGSSRKLQSLVDEVLDLSRMETRGVALQKKRKEIRPLLNRIVLVFESLLIKKGITLQYDSAALAGVWIDVDEDKFEKIINNLLYNAIKFNRDHGWIRVECCLADNVVVIEVSDSGTGIPEQDIPYIFDRFYQSSASDSKNAQGIGIGLSLVKEFTQLHGGKVEVTSRMNEGSTFTLTFPLLEVSAATLFETAGAEEDNVPDDKTLFPPQEKKPVVLVVEDNEEMRFYLKEILGTHAEIAEAAHGREALQWLATRIPDMIISDVMMPEMDGYAFLNQLKGSDQLKGIPVVMLTARASEEDLLHGLSLGVDDYIVKPFNARELKIRIHNLLTNQRVRKEWYSTPADESEKLAENTSDQQFIEKVQQLVEQRAADVSLGIGDLADHMAMSERQLYRKCGLTAGMTPAQLIKEIRLKIAYRLLINRQVTKVSDVASRVGYDNSAYFSRQFLEQFGKKPVDFL